MYKKLINAVLILFVVTLPVLAQPAAGPVVTLKSYLSFDRVNAGSEVKLAVKITVADSWHINSNKPKEDFLVPTELVIEGVKGAALASVAYPDAQDIKLEISDVPVSVYEHESYAGGIIKISDSLPVGEYKLVVKLNYQACNNQTCQAPTEAVDTVVLKVVDKTESVAEVNAEIFKNIAISYTAPAAAEVSEEDSLFKKLESSGLFISLIIVFFGGLALNLTPCVYPLIPITIGYFGGQSEGSTGRLAMMGLLYMLGIALTYSVVGVVTALSGAVFGALLQSPIVILAIVAVLFGLSLSMFGVYEFKMPDFLVQKTGDAKSGLFGAFFMGLTMGIVAAPCIGPFVLGLVTWVAAKADPLRGFLLFFSLALGLGSPYFVLALFSGKIKKLPRSGVWMEAIKHIFGFILIGMAIYFGLPLLPKSFSGYVLPVFMIGSGLYLIIFEKAGNNLKGFRTFKIVLSVVVIALGAFLLVPEKINSIAWEKYTDKTLEAASQEKKPVIIDFYADWCIPCKELDKLTFSKDNVIAESKRFVALKADMTKSVSPEVEALKNKFNIRGVPTVILLDANGKEVQRITGYMPAEKFLPLMQQVK
ncbi:MAG: thioredoxin fold domain-containing protein [Ignavibacteriales bacterium]|nr:thioredoxin fold domain-containing protein [Ignavibacteriales bacterium]